MGTNANKDGWVRQQTCCILKDMQKKGKLFWIGRSQAVRLPREFRLEGSDVYIRRDAATGDVILSRHTKSWEEFFELMKTIDVPHDFLADRKDNAPQTRIV